MYWALYFFLLAIIIELLVHLSGKWPKLRSGIALLSGVSTITVAAVLLAARFDLFTATVALLSLYRAFNMLRVIKRRMHEVYLTNATRRTSLVLLTVQGVTMLLWWIWLERHVTGQALWTAVAVLQVGVAGVSLLSVSRTLRKTRWPQSDSAYSDEELPSVTVAVPARNETGDLRECLASIIASDYPKLEVLVLDDCSQNKRTPEIIKAFAHDGVRFIQGEEPSDNWLPKNQAYARLAEEASGTYILFCGVDVRFAPHSIRKLVTVVLDRKKRMISLLPLRRERAVGRYSFVQAVRYCWELVPPRRPLHRPPVLSTCWIIARSALEEAGGFASVTRSVIPEGYFARSLTKTDGYSFLRADGVLGVESGKPISEQWETALRMRYPQLRHRPEQVAIASMIEAGLFMTPLLMLCAGLWVAMGAVASILAGVAFVMLIVVYTLVAVTTRVNSWWFGLIAQPLAVATDILLANYSMVRYELFAVNWKGRNVSVPVMHVAPHDLRGTRDSAVFSAS